MYGGRAQSDFTGFGSGQEGSSVRAVEELVLLSSTRNRRNRSSRYRRAACRSARTDPVAAPCSGQANAFKDDKL
uniref:Uncharacterized protein n=1 Tax=Fagus sylvatica TaxID=28930 RepID=A0A2N9I9D5_FAGSY